MQLSSVQPGRVVERLMTKFRKIRTAAANGTERDLLVALRNKIASDLDAGVPARDLASLSRRLLEIRRELNAIDSGEKGDDVGAAADTPDEAWTAQ